MSVVITDMRDTVTVIMATAIMAMEAMVTDTAMERSGSDWGLAGMDTEVTTRAIIRRTAATIRRIAATERPMLHLVRSSAGELIRIAVVSRRG